MTSPPSKTGFRCEYTLLRRERALSENPVPLTFRQVHTSGRTVQVVLSYAAGSANAEMDDIELTDEVATQLLSLGRLDGSKPSVEARAAIDPPLKEIHSTVCNLL